MTSYVDYGSVFVTVLAAALVVGLIGSGYFLAEYLHKIYVKRYRK